MKAHLRYASYVARHKWFVFRAGLKTKAPLWRLLIHDWSKLTPAEWGPYVRTFYAKEKARAGEFDAAWLHHQHRNPHHWQHWLLREDDGDTKTLPIPEPLGREMVADWMGAGRAITGKWDVASWYRANAQKIILAPETRVLVEALIFPGWRCVCESESKRFEQWSCPVHGIAVARLPEQPLSEHPGDPMTPQARSCKPKSPPPRVQG